MKVKVEPNAMRFEKYQRQLEQAVPAAKQQVVEAEKTHGVDSPEARDARGLLSKFQEGQKLTPQQFAARETEARAFKDLIGGSGGGFALGDAIVTPPKALSETRQSWTEKIAEVKQSLGEAVAQHGESSYEAQVLTEVIRVLEGDLGLTDADLRGRAKSTKAVPGTSDDYRQRHDAAPEGPTKGALAKLLVDAQRDEMLTTRANSELHRQQLVMLTGGIAAKLEAALPGANLPDHVKSALGGVASELRVEADATVNEVCVCLQKLATSVAEQCNTAEAPVAAAINRLVGHVLA